MNDALYDAILAAPEDDAPRLVYADRLIEQDDLRGEFIAVQCAVARLAREHKRHTAEYRAAKERSDKLFLLHEREWFDRVIGLARWEKTVTRGFISRASISAKALQIRWDRFGRMPLEEVIFHRRLTDLEYGPMGCPEIGRIAWLMRQPGGRRLRKVGISTNTGATEYDPAVLAPALASVDDADEALSWPDDTWPDRRLLPAMRRLYIFAREVRDTFIYERPPEIERLEEVRFRSDTELAVAFLERPHLPYLEKLELEATDQRGGFEASVIPPLVRSSVLATLVNVRIDATLTEDLVHALEQAPNLEILNLAVGATDAGIRAFAASSLPARLRSLTINYSKEEISARPLAEAPFAKLETLILSGFAIDDDTGRAFAANPAFATVVDVHFSYTPWLDGLTAIAESPHWNAAINASFHRINGDDARRALLRSRWGIRWM